MPQDVKYMLNTGWEKFEQMSKGSPIGATIHRTQPSDHQFADTARGVYDLYSKHPECKDIAKGSIPFHIVIEPSGQVVQTAPLNQKLWHAYKLNSTHVGICCVGDFREKAMPAAQRAALVGVCVGLMRESDREMSGLAQPFSSSEFLGHTEKPEGSRHPDLESPGKQVDLPQLRADIETAFRENMKDAYTYFHCEKQFFWKSDTAAADANVRLNRADKLSRPQLIFQPYEQDSL
jgi:hypothetical protein